MNKLTNSIIVFLTILLGYNTYLLHTLEKQLDDKVINLTGQIDKVRISTDGKLHELDANYKTLAKTNTTQVVTREISYIPKESKEDADVEINNAKPTVSVRVNGSPKYTFNTLTDEKYKFEQGKLLINTASTSSIDITASDYPRSPWTLTGAVNSNKKVVGALSYDIGHATALTVMAGQELKPYYGVTFRIGSHK